MGGVLWLGGKMGFQFITFSLKKALDNFSKYFFSYYSETDIYLFLINMLKKAQYGLNMLIHFQAYLTGLQKH